VTTYGRLACAAILSLVLHGLVISGAWVPLPQSPDDPKPLRARLVPAEAKPALPVPAKRAPRRAAPTPAPDVPVVAAASPIVLPDYQPDAALEDTVADEPAAPEPPQKVALVAESSAVIARTMPRRGQITFTLLYGNANTPVGKVVQSWEVENDSYQIASEAETTGIVEFFRPQRLRYLSKGRVTREGLRPDSFLMSRTRRGQTDAAQARFDWGAGSLAYGLARDPKSAPLPAGTQDVMTLIYQHTVNPPAPGRFKVPVTTGSRFDVYEIEVMAEESIETPIGTLRALQVKQLSQPGMESIHIWLATDYHYLPVRIRHYDREGNYSGEQMVSEIRISQD
jgi:hypothetical protein